MIGGLIGNGSVIVTNGNSSLPYISVSYDEKNPIMGMVRVNGSNLEAFNGTSWIAFTHSFATVGLSGSAESAINWAMTEQRRAMEREQLIKNNPALQNAWDAIKRAEDNFDLLSKFVENDTNNNEEWMAASP